jgi:hypothetical protein
MVHGPGSPSCRRCDKKLAIDRPIVSGLHAFPAPIVREQKET